MSIPAGFAAAIIGTLVGGRRRDEAAAQEAAYQALEVRALTGIGAV